MPVAMQIVGMRKRYKDFELKDVDLTIPEGAIVGLIGQNGAGKSTLLKCILGLVKRDAGRVRMPCAGDPTLMDLRRVTGYIPETLIFYDWMTVGRLICFVSAFYPTWDHGYARDLLTRYELEPGKKVKHLSRGMRTKLALLLALSHHPPMLLLDEPTAGLDPVMKHHFLQEIRRQVNTGVVKAVLISSHILGEIEKVADRVALLQNGVLRLEEDVSGMLRRWKKITFSAPKAAKSISQLGIHSLGDGRLMVLTETESDKILQVLDEAGAMNIEVAGPDLQEIFLQLTQPAFGEEYYA
jgi:ABC-2 type transport system ATP-binding protein